MLNEQRQRMVLQLDSNEMDNVNEFRWKNRIPSRTEAVRQLIAMGLKAETQTAEAASTAPTAKS